MKMAKLERVYNIPLRKEYMKAPRHKRTPKAVKALREFVSKHMKSDNIIIGKYLNELLWQDGIKRPPHHVRVNTVKDDAGKVLVELVDKPLPTEKVKEEKKTGLKIPFLDKLQAKTPKKEKAEKKEEPKEKAAEKPEPKQETTPEKKAEVTPKKEKQATSEGQ